MLKAVTYACWLLFLLLGATQGRRYLDLTHTLDENAPQYPLEQFGAPPNASYYQLKTWSESWYPSGMWLAFKYVEFYEHMGTHIDAPYHFGANAWTMEQMPIDRLVGPGVNIDVRDKVKKDPNYAVTVDDIKDYEAKYAKIPSGAIVMMNSGWGEKYNNAQLVFGTDNLSNSSTFNFPGFSLDACKFLLTQRQVSVLGVDTPSTDPGNLPAYYCHMYLQPNNVPLLEYVANLDTMPAAGTTVFLGALKHRGGTGGQVRIICMIEDDDDRDYSGAGTRPMAGVVVPSAVALLLLAMK